MNRTRTLGLLAVVVAAASAGAQAPAPRPTPAVALLVLNKEDASLAIVDPSTRHVVGRVPTGEGPHEVAVSSDGTLAFAANYGARTPGSTLSVIDLVAQKELRRVDLKPFLRPHGLAVADGKVFFTSETEKTIGQYDPASGEIARVFRTGQEGTHMVLVSRDTKTIVAVNIGSNTITMLERAPATTNTAAAGWLETVIPVGRGPEGLDWSPNGKELWTAHSRDGGVSIIDAATKHVVETLNLQTKRSNRLKFTPDGRRVLVTDLDAGELIVVDATTRKEIRRLKLGKSPEGILVAPDGSRAYVAVNGDNNVAIIDLKMLEETGRISTGNGPDGMAWAVR